MKIVIIMPLAEQRGGGELMLLHLMQQGRGAGVEWHVIFLNSGPMIRQVQALGVKTTLITSGRIRDIPRLAATAAQIAKLVKRERITAIISWMATAQLYGGWAAWGAGVPAIWYQLGVPDRGRLDRLATYLPAAGILACSRTGENAQARLWPRRPIRVVYPGAEMERFDPKCLPKPSALRRRLGLPEEGPLIGIVGRLQRWKGMHVLLQAMPRIVGAHPDAHCVIVGGTHALEPDYPDFLAAERERLKLHSCVTMAGLQQNVPDWMHAMDVVVHASDHEPFGIVIIEAMALGKPVVAGNAAGPCEIITDGVDGLLTPYGDPAALAEAVLRFLGDPGFTCRVGAAARARASEFSTERYAQSFIDAVQALLAGAGGKAV